MAKVGYKRITFEERKVIEKLLKEGYCALYIANFLNRSNPSIYYELKRCKCIGNYSADYAQLDSMKRNVNKSKRPILEIDKELAQYISTLILKEELSAVDIVRRLTAEGYVNAPLSKNTIYAAIDNGLIPSVNRKTLLLKRKKTHMFSNGLIKIPKWIREELDIRDDQELKINIMQGKIIIQK